MPRALSRRATLSPGFVATTSTTMTLCSAGHSVGVSSSSSVTSSAVTARPASCVCGGASTATDGEEVKADRISVATMKARLWFFIDETFRCGDLGKNDCLVVMLTHCVWNSYDDSGQQPL